MTELTKADRIAWKNFMATPAGQKARVWLLERALSQPVARQDSPNITAIDAGTQRGYANAIQDFDSLPILDEPPNNQPLD